MFEYYTLQDTEQIRFYQLPRELVKHERFKGLSDSAKILYSLLRDRVALSAKNDWVDDLGRVYIIFTLTEIMEDLNCADQKATKSMKELQKIGLIESVRRGLGKPNLIYVKNFSTGIHNSETRNIPLTRENHESGTVKITNQEPLKSRVLNRENHEQSIPTLKNTNFMDTDIKSESASDGVWENEKKEEKNENDLTLTNDDYTANEEIKEAPVTKQAEALKYNKADYDKYERQIKKNIEYEHYAKYDRGDIQMIDGLVEIMLDVILTENPPTVKIGKETKNREIVKNIYLKLNSSHIDHIISQYKDQRHKITHKPAYLKTMLYNVYSEIDAHYVNQVRADGAV